MTKLSQCARCKKDRRNCEYYKPEDDMTCPHYSSARSDRMSNDEDDKGCLWRMVLVIVVVSISAIANLTGAAVPVSTVAIAILAGLFLLAGIIWLIFGGVNFNNMLRSHHLFFRMMEELRKEEFAKQF